MKRKILLIPLFALALLWSCRKDKLNDDGLPPATQEGKNTAGFLLNGEPFLPGGKKAFGESPHFYLSIDPTYNDGSCGGQIKRNVNGQLEYLIFGSDSCKGTAVLPVPHNRNGVLFITPSIKVGEKDKRYSSSDTTIKTTGYYQMTRYDIENGIFSGIFEFHFMTPTDTVHITKGRFDYKF